RLPAAVYHFHDPELIPWAWLLLLRRAPVVYDVHEDYAVAVAHKQYLPAWLRRRLGRLVDVAERALTRPFRIVIAEDCYASRFPQGLRVRNYPPRSLLSVGPAFDARSRRLLYTGNVTEERGALNLAGVAAVASDLRITLVGRCSPALASRMRAIAGDAGASRMTIIGEGRYVPFSEIRARYAEGDWLCGTALFPDSPHYREKALTKFFEYMAAGLPVIASDVPFWRRLIVEQGLGICVDSTDPRAAVQAARRFAEDPAEAREMGRRGRELVRRHYNWEYQGAALVAFYRSLLRTV
ncbi:MAG: glycosyltransferase, partial [Spirochaetaceae bacterium]